MKSKIFLVTGVTLVLYYIISLFVFNGRFVVEHDFSYSSMEEAKKNKTFISNNLDIAIEGDSLQRISGLKNKFYLTKSTFQKFYGFIISFDMEDKNYRMVSWEEPIKQSLGRNWIVVDEENNYLGEAFFVGNYDGKIGEKIILTIKNSKTDNKIGEIIIQIR